MPSVGTPIKCMYYPECTKEYYIPGAYGNHLQDVHGLAQKKAFEIAGKAFSRTLQRRKARESKPQEIMRAAQQERTIPNPEKAGLPKLEFKLAATPSKAGAALARAIGNLWLAYADAIDEEAR